MSFGKTILQCWLWFCCFLFVGCNNFSASVDPVVPESSNSEILTLGNKLENPYSVKNILRARDSLVAKGVLSKTAIADETLTATHYYIRFKPATDSQYALISHDSTLVLWDYPLDYDIPEDGTVYRDPEIPAGQPAYLYTAIRIGSPTPDVEYEILEELILEPENDRSTLSKSVSLYNYNLLEQEALRITGNLKSSSDVLNKVMGEWNPSGSIMVYDEVLSRNMPVAGVDVRVRNWFKWWDGNTDDNGNFYCSKGYSGDVAYSLRWNYPWRFDIRSGGAGQAFYNGPNNKRGRWDLLISSGMSRVYAHVFRAGAYYIRSETFGLRNEPFDLISVCAYDENNTHTDGNAFYNHGNNNILIWRKNNSGVAYNSLQLFSYASHEFAHAEHDKYYPRDFAKIDDKIKESWAHAIEYFFAARVYGVDYKMYICWPIPNGTGSLTYEGWNRTSKYTPLIIDLVDNTNQINYLDASIALNDEVSGYTLQQIETILSHGGCIGMQDFKNEINALPLPSSMTSAIVQAYLSYY